MTLSEFYKELEQHDWYHDYSDDLRVASQGQTNYERLVKLAHDLGLKYQRLMLEYQAAMFSGSAFGTLKLPKPQKPKE